MPYFGAGGGGVAYQAPRVLYRQSRRPRRFGQSLSDIFGTISNVAGDISQGASGPSGGTSGYGPGAYVGAPYSPPATMMTALPSTGISGTTLVLGAAALGGLYLLTQRRRT